MANHLIRTGDIAIGTGSHGASCCRHSLVGHWVKGAESVMAEGRYIIRTFSDIGIHNCPHCGTMTAIDGIQNTFAEGKSLHYLHGAVNFNCGVGVTITASDTII